MGLLKNKKALELAINTIIILVLAIVVLLFLFLFFTNAGEDFLGKIKSYSSYSNIDNLVESCNILSQTNQEYNFCCERKIVKYYENEKRVEQELNCKELSNKDFINNRIKSLDCGDISC